MFLLKRVGVWDGWEGAAVVNGCRSTQFDKEHSKVRKRGRAAGASLPSVVLDHVSQLDDELSLFVLLTALKRVLLQERTEKGEKLVTNSTFFLSDTNTFIRLTHI